MSRLSTRAGAVALVSGVTLLAGAGLSATPVAASPASSPVPCSIASDVAGGPYAGKLGSYYYTIDNGPATCTLSGASGANLTVHYTTTLASGTSVDLSLVSYDASANQGAATSQKLYKSATATVSSNTPAS